jgi:hypothetical protein
MSAGFRVIITTALLFGVALLYWWYDPAASGRFPSCPFHHFTGLFCPGCGSQRALHSLLHGHILKAADYNLVLVLYLPLILIYYADQLFRFLMHRKLVNIGLVNNVAFIYLTLFLFIIFAVVRNTDSAAGIFLAP